jgi:hypothetical protein
MSSAHALKQICHTIAQKSQDQASEVIPCCQWSQLSMHQLERCFRAHSAWMVLDTSPSCTGLDHVDDASDAAASSRNFALCNDCSSLKARLQGTGRYPTISGYWSACGWSVWHVAGGCSMTQGASSSIPPPMFMKRSSNLVLFRLIIIILF